MQDDRNSEKGDRPKGDGFAQSDQRRFLPYVQSSLDQLVVVVKLNLRMIKLQAGHLLADVCVVMFKLSERDRRSRHLDVVIRLERCVIGRVALFQRREESGFHLLSDADKI